MTNEELKLSLDIRTAQRDLAETRVKRMAEALKVIGYPARGTWEETDFVHLQDAANYVQQNFTLEELSE